MDGHLPPLPSDIIEQLNNRRGEYTAALGLKFTSAAYDQVEAEVTVGSHLHQPFGLVHGGVYATIVETVASIGAALHVFPENKQVVGLENTTTFLRATRDGTLKAVGRPLTTGRRTHVWEVSITNDDQKLAATGRVRLLVLDKAL